MGYGHTHEQTLIMIMECAEVLVNLFLSVASSSLIQLDQSSDVTETFFGEYKLQNNP